MEQFTQELQEQLQVETAFTIPVLGGIEIAESTVVTWLIMAILTALSIYLGANLKVRNPGKRQQAAEFIVSWLDNFTGGLLGPHGTQYRTLIAVIVIYIGLANMIGIFGIKPPTKDMNVTLGLSLISICTIEFSGFRRKGLVGYIKHFSQPVAIVTPINILELAIKPLSLCMRLFGNVLGAFIIMELIKMVVPVGLPAILSLYFDLFDGLIQAYVFVFLTSLYIQEATE